ncbi:hypothetical protein ACJX0J_036232, partial [Zea mays]
MYYYSVCILKGDFRIHVNYGKGFIVPFQKQGLMQNKAHNLYDLRNLEHKMGSQRDPMRSLTSLYHVGGWIIQNKNVTTFFLLSGEIFGHVYIVVFFSSEVNFLTLINET